MSKLVVVIPYSSNDCVLAERLLDFIYALNGKRAIGHVLLVAAAEVHEEMRTKVSISAKIAFEEVSETICPVPNQKQQYNKAQYANQLFRHAARYVQGHFRWPFLWCEPDCVPTKPDWIAQLGSSYDSQPKRYLGSHMKQGERLFMARVGVYHPGASSELDKFCEGEVGFNTTQAAELVIPKCSKTKLIQQLSFSGEHDIEKVRPDAVLVHGDKTGVLIEHLRTASVMSNDDWNKFEKDVMSLRVGDSVPVRQIVEKNGRIESHKPKLTPSERMAVARAARGKKSIPLKTTWIK